MCNTSWKVDSYPWTRWNTCSINGVNHKCIHFDWLDSGPTARPANQFVSSPIRYAWAFVLFPCWKLLIHLIFRCKLFRSSLRPTDWGCYANTIPHISVRDLRLPSLRIWVLLALQTVYPDYSWCLESSYLLSYNTSYLRYWFSCSQDNIRFFTWSSREVVSCTCDDNTLTYSVRSAFSFLNYALRYLVVRWSFSISATTSLNEIYIFWKL